MKGKNLRKEKGKRKRGRKKEKRRKKVLDDERIMKETKKEALQKKWKVNIKRGTTEIEQDKQERQRWNNKIAPSIPHKKSSRRQY